jgi:anaphase-promoting complex subunit 10
MDKPYIESNSAPITNTEKREIGDEAVWTLSSAKAGNGVEQLRDENTNTFWQSDGAQPHFVNIQFMKKTRVQVRIIII